MKNSKIFEDKDRLNSCYIVGNASKEYSSVSSGQGHELRPTVLLLQTNDEDKSDAIFSIAQNIAKMDTDLVEFLDYKVKKDLKEFIHEDSTDSVVALSPVFLDSFQS